MPDFHVPLCKALLITSCERLTPTLTGLLQCVRTYRYLSIAEMNLFVVGIKTNPYFFSIIGLLLLYLLLSALKYEKFDENQQDDHGDLSSVNMDTAVAIRTLEATYKSSADAASVDAVISNLIEKVRIITYKSLCV